MPTFEQIFRGRWMLEHAIRHLANRCARSAQLGLFIPDKSAAELDAYKILSELRRQLEEEFERKRSRRACRLKQAPQRRRSA